MSLNTDLDEKSRRTIIKYSQKGIPFNTFGNKYQINCEFCEHEIEGVDLKNTTDRYKLHLRDFHNKKFDTFLNPLPEVKEIIKDLNAGKTVTVPEATIKPPLILIQDGRGVKLYIGNESYITPFVEVKGFIETLNYDIYNSLYRAPYKVVVSSSNLEYEKILAYFKKNDINIIPSIKEDIAKGNVVTVPQSVVESTPSTDWNYALKIQLKREQDERKKLYPTVEAFRVAKQGMIDLLSSDFHLKSYKDKAEKYKPGTIQYNKHMAEYNAKLKEIAELRREAESGKTIHELKLEETMRENDEATEKERSEKDTESKRDARLRNTDTEALKQLAFGYNLAWVNESLSWKERHAAKDEGRAILAVLHERGIDISKELTSQTAKTMPAMPNVSEIKRNISIGKTVTIPESSIQPQPIKKNKGKYYVTLVREGDTGETYNVRKPIEKAYPFTYEGIDFFASQDVDNKKFWNVTEVQTGLIIPGQGKTKASAIDAVKETIDRLTPAKIKDLIANNLKKQEKEEFREEEPHKSVEEVLADAQKGAIEDLSKDYPELAKRAVIAGKTVTVPETVIKPVIAEVNETARFGEKVLVSADPHLPDVYPAYKGTIVRVLNDGKLIEVRPEGQKEGSFRVDASRVSPDIGEIKKEIAEGETVTLPEQTLKANLEFTPMPISTTTKELAARSHAYTSFSPEKRAEQEIESLQSHIHAVYEDMRKAATTEAQKAFLIDEMKRYEAGYTSKFNADLAAKGRTFSVMITGGSGFNNRAHEKANNAEQNRYEDMQAWDERAQAAILRELRKLKIQEGGGELEVLKKKLADAEKMQEMMKKGNAIIRKNIDTDTKKNQLMELGFSETEAIKIQKPDVMKDIGFAHYRLQNNLANIKRMQERVKELEKKEATPSKDIKFSGGTIVDNAEQDRVQIQFDSIPDEALRTKLKGEGWRWSPFNKAWQRKRTDAAIYSAERILGIKVERERFVPQKPELLPEIKAKIDAAVTKIMDGKTAFVPESAVKKSVFPPIDFEFERQQTERIKKERVPEQEYEDANYHKDFVTEYDDESYYDDVRYSLNPKDWDIIDSEIKQDLAKGKTVTVPESVIKTEPKKPYSELINALIEIKKSFDIWYASGGTLDSTYATDMLSSAVSKTTYQLRNGKPDLVRLLADLRTTTGFVNLREWYESQSVTPKIEKQIASGKTVTIPEAQLKPFSKIPAPIYKVGDSSKDYKSGYSLAIQGKIAPAVPAWSDQGKADFAQGYKDGQVARLEKGKTISIPEKELIKVMKPKPQDKPEHKIVPVPLLLYPSPVFRAKGVIKSISSGKTITLPASELKLLMAAPEKIKMKAKPEHKKTKKTEKTKEKGKCKPPVKVGAHMRSCPTKR